MPVLKIKKNGVWENVSGGNTSMSGGNADTLDGKHASDFASALDVAEQIDNAINELREEILGGEW